MWAWVITVLRLTASIAASLGHGRSVTEGGVQPHGVIPALDEAEARLRASAWDTNRRRLSSSHSRVAKKLSHIACRRRRRPIPSTALRRLPCSACRTTATCTGSHDGFGFQALNRGVLLDLRCRRIPWHEPVIVMRRRCRISSHSVAAQCRRLHHDPLIHEVSGSGSGTSALRHVAANQYNGPLCPVIQRG